MTDTTKRVFIIDDNVLIRYALTELLNSEAGIMVVGDAAPGDQLDQLIHQTKPDLLIFDIPLPRSNGIRTLRSWKRFHLPAIVFTKSDLHFTADLIPLLEAGAVGFVIKPENDSELRLVKHQLVYEIKRNTIIKEKHTITTLMTPLKCICIGASTGGPEALSSILPLFPPDCAAGVAIVQHMPKNFTGTFAARLNKYGPLAVKEAAEGDRLKAGLILLAPGDAHLTFVADEADHHYFAKSRLTNDPPQWGLRPTVDQMMTSLAPLYGKNLVGIILTGMGQDGVVGMKAIKAHGGHTLVQNKETSVVFGMAQEVIKNNLADEVLPLPEIIPRALEVLNL